MTVIKKLVSIGLMALPMMVATAASAASYPDKQIRWVVPYAAGGGSDFLARSIGNGLSARIKQPVVVENKPGGNTAIAATDVARSEPDGYTVLSADNGTMVFNPALYKTLTYDANKDLAPVTLLGRFPMILVVDPKSGINSAEEFIARAKADNKRIDYGSAGAGSPHHLAMELLNAELSLNMVHVPYRGAAPALADVAGGQVPAMMVDLAAGAGFINGGKVKPLAVAHPERLPQLPDVPTFAELGYKNIVAAAHVGMVVPAGTPAATIEALNKEVVAVLNEPDVRKRLVDFGVEPVGNTPAEYREMLKTETERWHKLISDLKISLE
jgi:tripartite-type tricarboxylate transporter receptor subunit TctC